MSLTQLLGGPQFDVSSNEYALYADFHYFFNSGSVIRSNPWDSPSTPVAKVLNVTNITANNVALNYVNTSGSIVATTMTSGSTTQITAQTLPLGLDNNNWLSASFVSNFTGSVVARPTGSRFFELESIRSVSQDTYVYTIADAATTITRTNTGFPSVGSLTYRCSRTIPYLDQPFWLIRDLAGCPGGTTTTTTAGPTTTTTSTTTTSTTTTTTTTTSTTTTTTAAPTTTTTSTTTTTTLASQKYLLTSCVGDGDIIGIFTILNAPLLAPGDGIRIAGGIAGLYCFQVNNTSTGTSLGDYSITNIYPGVPCDDCSE
jgi:hypothetical protein